MPVAPETTPVDLTQFKGLVAGFLSALATDDRYAVDMVRTAAAVQRKRDIWALRVRYRELSGRTKATQPPQGWTWQDAIAVLEDPKPLPPREHGHGRGRRLRADVKASLVARAVQLKAEGLRQCQIAQELGVSQMTVSNWLRKA